METFVFILLILLAFVTGMVTNQLRNLKKAEREGCPFKQACLIYNPVETKAAIRRILNLMITNDVPLSEIRNEIDKSLSA